MPSHIERLHRQFSAVYLTLSSVVVALALEKLLDRMAIVAPLPPGDVDGLLVWLLGVVLFVTTFAIWILSSYTDLALRWDIGVLDAAGPFFILVLLGAAVATIGRSAVAFFYIAALGQGSGYVLLRQILAEARRYPVNDPLLKHSDYRATYVAGLLSTAVPLATAVLLQAGAIGVRGAVVGAAVLLLTLFVIVGTFSRSWWGAVAAADAEGKPPQEAVQPASDTPETP